MMRNPWEDVDGISDRQPAYCPYCGYNGAFDGLGKHTDGYKHFCGECGQEFLTVLP